MPARELEGTWFRQTVSKGLGEPKHSRTPVRAGPPSSNKSPHSRLLLEQLQDLSPGPVGVKVRLPKELARTRDPWGKGNEMQAAETLLTFPGMTALSTFAPGTSLLGMTLESLIRLTFLRKPCHPLSAKAQFSLL